MSFVAPPHAWTTTPTWVRSSHHTHLGGSSFWLPSDGSESARRRILTARRGHIRAARWSSLSIASDRSRNAFRAFGSLLNEKPSSVNSRVTLDHQVATSGDNSDKPRCTSVRLGPSCPIKRFRRKFVQKDSATNLDSSISQCRASHKAAESCLRLSAKRSNQNANKTATNVASAGRRIANQYPRLSGSTPRAYRRRAAADPPRQDEQRRAAAQLGGGGHK